MAGAGSTPEGGSGSSEGGGHAVGGAGAGGDTSAGGVVSEGGGGGQPSEPEPECPKPEGEICHEFFVTDNARNQLSYVNEFAPETGWTKPVNVTGVNSPRQVELVDNANSSNGKAALVSVNTGYQEYDMVTGTRLVNVVLASTTDVRGAVRLPSGNTLLGVGNDKLRVVDGNGVTVGTECTLPGAGTDSLRTLTRDPATGYVLLGRLLDVFIVSDACQLQWSAKLPVGSKAYAVRPRAGGGVWASTGASTFVVEYNQATELVGSVGGKNEHPGLGFDFFTDFRRLPNGNIVVANWQGHIASPAETTPHLFELTPGNTVVWSWGTQTLARQATGVYVIR
jgi:hypothetical protein